MEWALAFAAICIGSVAIGLTLYLQGRQIRKGWSNYERGTLLLKSNRSRAEIRDRLRGGPVALWLYGSDSGAFLCSGDSRFSEAGCSSERTEGAGGTKQDAD